MQEFVYPTSLNGVGQLQAYFAEPVIGHVMILLRLAPVPGLGYADRRDTARVPANHLAWAMQTGDAARVPANRHSRNPWISDTSGRYRVERLQPRLDPTHPHQ